MPLTKLSQRAGATIPYPSAVEDPQTAIGFPALLSGAQRLASWALQHPVGLEGEVLPGELPRLPGQGDRRLALALHRCLPRGGRFEGGSKLSGAQRRGCQLMPQFQPQVPHPLCHDLPHFLSCGRVTTPAVWVDLLLTKVHTYALEGDKEPQCSREW
jgi:hypothetical protein